MTAPELAVLCGNDLRTILAGRWADAETRRQAIESTRTALARQMAEDATGVSFATAALTGIYSRSQLSDGIVARSRRYREALVAAYTELPATMADLLTTCDRMARDAAMVA